MRRGFLCRYFFLTQTIGQILSGTNAHIILEEASATLPLKPTDTLECPVQLLVLSAKDKWALQAQAKRLADYLRSHPEIALPDVTHTLATARSHFDHRLALRVKDTTAAISRLAGFVKQERTPEVIVGQAASSQPRIAFLFTGQGSQYLGMGRELSIKELKLSLLCQIPVFPII